MPKIRPDRYFGQSEATAEEATIYVDARGQIMLFDHDAHDLCYLADSFADFSANPVL